MPIQLYDYQQRAFDSTFDLWKSGIESVLVVSPTGSGKTVIGTSIANQFKKPLWIVHRNELIKQAAEKLPLLATVATVQSLAKQPMKPFADVVVFDEAHHYVAKEWGKVAGSYTGIPKLGLTATPERRDGRPLGDMFQEIIVGAHYSELLRDGKIAPCRIVRPEYQIDDGLAQEAVKAYKQFAPGSLAFCFATTVGEAKALAGELCEAGFPSVAIHDKLPSMDRQRAIDDFKAGRVRVLTNVYILTEGVDVPQAETCILARKCEHCGPFMQMAGRVLRTHPDKKSALLIDLPGATFKHGSPTDDRVYSLSGNGMSPSEPVPYRQCPSCFELIMKGLRRCPRCGYEFVSEGEARSNIRIYDMALVEVYAGNDTPIDAKKREWDRLSTLCNLKGWGLSWAIKEYRKIFPGESPKLNIDEMSKLKSQLNEFAKTKGFKPGWAYFQLKNIMQR